MTWKWYDRFRVTTCGIVLVALMLSASTFTLHCRVSGTQPGREDINLAWQDGVQLAEGINPYSRIHSGDMRKSEGYPTYLPAFYVLSAALDRCGITEFADFLLIWRPICECSSLAIAIWLLIAGTRRGSLAFGCLASCFFFYSRWTLTVVNIAHLDTLSVLIWIASLELSTRPQRRHRLASCFLFGLSLTIKQIALFALPLYLIWEWQAENRRQAIRRTIISLVMILAIPLLFSVPFLIWDPTGFAKSILFSGTRAAGGDFASKSIDAAMGLSGFTARLPMLGLLGLLYQSVRRFEIGHFAAALMVIGIWLNFNSVLFYQYMVWAVPLLPLACLEAKIGLRSVYGKSVVSPPLNESTSLEFASPVRSLAK